VLHNLVVGGVGVRIHGRPLRICSERLRPGTVRGHVPRSAEPFEITTGKAARRGLGSGCERPFLPRPRRFREDSLADACDHLGARPATPSFDPEKGHQEAVDLKPGTPRWMWRLDNCRHGKAEMERRGNLFYLKARPADQASEEGAMTDRLVGVRLRPLNDALRSTVPTQELRHKSVTKGDAALYPI
jgi:hypothetical protein